MTMKIINIIILVVSMTGVAYGQAGQSNQISPSGDELAIRNTLNQSINTFCKGKPRFLQTIAETIGARIGANPNSVSLDRVEIVGVSMWYLGMAKTEPGSQEAREEHYNGCNGVFYTPKGPFNCNLHFNNNGIVTNICDRSIIAGEGDSNAFTRVLTEKLKSLYWARVKPPKRPESRPGQTCYEGATGRAIPCVNVENAPVVKVPPVAAPIVKVPPVAAPVIAEPVRVQGTRFKDCDDCPEMVVIPAGSFEMGGKAVEETPSHRVTLSAFSIGRTEVTQGQWLSIMGNVATMYEDCGNTCPIAAMSWETAKLFISRLNAKTGKQYRLPSEAEWEYACRAGGQDDYCGSGRADDLGWHGSNSGGAPHPVAGKKANAWGLHDMSGNVLEWTEDCANANYNGAPTDGRSWSTGDCSKRVVRGGSWLTVPELAGAAYRSFFAVKERRYFLGFRVARDN